MNTITFEDLKEENLPKILEIYNYYVLNSTATFHTNTLYLEAMRELVFFNDPKYRTFIIKDNEELCGYISIIQHKKRSAYDGTAEITIYLDHEHIGKGLGSLALKYAEKYAKDSGFHVLVATLCSENIKSIQLNEKNGYVKCAHYREVGYKFDKFLDVVAYQKIL
jgi:L-amino acid N-acyltransferase YncA